MSKQIQDYLRTTLPIQGVPFDHLSRLGRVNLELIIKYFDYLLLYEKDREINTVTRNYLNTVLIKTPQVGSDLPVLPSLRNRFYVSQGDEVMLYVGRNSERYWVDSSPKRYSWIYGVVLGRGVFIDIVDIFTHQGLDRPMSEYRGRLHEIDLESPLFFKRDEFLQLQKMVKNEINPDFLKVFGLNSRTQDSKFHNPVILFSKVVSPHIEAPTEKERQILHNTLLQYCADVLEVDLRKPSLQTV